MRRFWWVGGNKELSDWDKVLSWLVKQALSYQTKIKEFVEELTARVVKYKKFFSTNQKETWKIYSVWTVTQRHLQKNSVQTVCCFFLVCKVTFLCSLLKLCLIHSLRNLIYSTLQQNFLLNKSFILMFKNLSSFATKSSQYGEIRGEFISATDWIIIIVLVMTWFLALG